MAAIILKYVFDILIYLIFFDYIFLIKVNILLILIMWFTYKKGLHHYFTLTFIVWIAIIIYIFSADYIKSILAVSVFIYTNNGLQPIFYPLVSSYDSGTETYITRKCRKPVDMIILTGNEFDESNKNELLLDENKLDDFNKNEFDSCLYRNFKFTIRLPLIPVFKKVKIDFPTSEIKVEFDELNYKLPGLKPPIPQGNSLLLETNLTAWNVSQVIYPVKTYLRLEKRVNVKISMDVRWKKEEENKTDFYIIVSVTNNENYLIDHYEFFGYDIIDEVQCNIDEEQWNKIKTESTNLIIGDQISRRFQETNMDKIGFNKGNIFGIIHKLGPKQTNFYEFGKPIY